MVKLKDKIGLGFGLVQFSDPIVCDQVVPEILKEQHHKKNFDKGSVYKLVPLGKE